MDLQVVCVLLFRQYVHVFRELLKSVMPGISRYSWCHVLASLEMQIDHGTIPHGQLTQ